MFKNQISNRNYLFTHLWISISLVIILITTGTTVYQTVFGFDPVNAFYMTIITIGTVGFGEVEPLTNEGKIFTSFLILFSIFIFAYAFTTISAYLVSINTVFNFYKKKMENNIKKLNGHVIICGFGRNGKQAANRLKIYKRDFVVIEKNTGPLRELEDEGHLFVQGNATDDETLMNAGILNADYLITTLPSDTDNVFITLSSKQMKKKLIVVSRASEETSIKKLKIAGADNIIMPDKIGGDHMASLIVAPDLVEFLDNLSTSSSGSMNIQEIMISNESVIHSIDELKIKEKTGCTIIGYKTAKGNYIVNPDPDQKVELGGRVIVLGNEGQIKKLNHVFHVV